MCVPMDSMAYLGKRRRRVRVRPVLPDITVRMRSRKYRVPLVGMETWEVQTTFLQGVPRFAQWESGGFSRGRYRLKSLATFRAQPQCMASREIRSGESPRSLHVFTAHPVIIARAGRIKSHVVLVIMETSRTKVREMLHAQTHALADGMERKLPKSGQWRVLVQSCASLVCMRVLIQMVNQL